MNTIDEAWLEGLGPPVTGQRFELNEFPFRLGRGSTCQLYINDPQISREHAEIRYQAGRFVLRDLNSVNGTLLNGQRVIEAVLLPGDRLRLGESEFVFRLEQDYSPTVITPPRDLRAENEQFTMAAAQPSFTQSPAPTGAFPAASQSPVPPAKLAANRPKRSGFSVLIIVLGVFGLLSMCTCGGCYVFYSLGNNVGGVTNHAPSNIPDLKAALALKPIDQRPEVLAWLGLPDTFTISDQEVEGGKVRFEAWQYSQYGLRVDFVDGQIAWTIDIARAPDGTIYPAWYNPLDFKLGMSPEEAMELARDSAPADALPVWFDLSEGGQDLEGVVTLVGDLLVMGFYQDQLVYVETLALIPKAGEP